MFNFSKIIDKILKFDQLNSNINLDRFNNEERGLLKLVCYKNHTLNFQFYKKTIKYSLKIYFFLIKIDNFFSRDIKQVLLLISNSIKKKKSFPKLNVDIIFFLSQDPRDQKDTIPIVSSFAKKIIIVDVDFKRCDEYRKLFRNTKIINIQDYIQLKDFFLALIKALKFSIKFLIFKSGKSHALLNFFIYLSFFLRTKIYQKIITNIKTNKVFIDRCNGEGNSFFITQFKKNNKNNKIFSYSLNGLALNNDLIASHYLYSDLDYLFCYGQFDKIFITKLFNKNKFKLLKAPNKVIPVGSIRNFLYKIQRNIKKRKILKKNFNFLYIKSNSFIYNSLDNLCFEKFCLFANKHFPKSNILIKEKNNDISQKNNDLINRKLIFKKNIYNSIDTTPEEIYKKIDFVVGTTSAALSQAIYYNIPVISLDNHIIISSFLKFFSPIHVSSVNNIEAYKTKIITIGNSPKQKNKIRDFIFKNIYKNPKYEIVDIIKNEK